MAKVSGGDRLRYERLTGWRRWRRTKCLRCGGLVYDRELHDQFHDRIDRAEMKASRTDRIN